MPVYKNIKTKTTTWFFRLYITDELGRRKQCYKGGFKSRKEAKEAEQLLLLKYEQKDYPVNNENNDDITFQELYNVYIKNVEQSLKYKSYITYENIFINHILPYFKDFKIKDIDNKSYIEWKSIILNKGLSIKYIRSIHVCMVTILNYAMKFYNLESNIASKIGNFSKKYYQPNEDFWTYEEFSKFIENIKEIEYRTLYILLFFSGARIGECLALNWNDFRDDYIDITKTLSKGRKGEKYVIQSPKTLSSIRKVQLDDYTIKAMNELKKYYQGFYGFDNSWFIFGGIKPLARTTIATKKNNCCETIGIKKIKMHGFRHSHATLLISQRVPIPVVSKRLGHKDISTTLDKYSHVVPKDEDMAIQFINDLNKDLKS